MNKWIVFLLLIIVVAVVWQLRAHTMQHDEFVSVGVSDFVKLISDSDSVALLDVRTQQEYEEAHIANAYLIDIKDSTFLVKAREILPKEKTIAVYCRSGRRSATAATVLARDGYRVVNLLGGILAWTKEGQPVTEGKSE